jgi:rod shape-determining protein MreC
MARQKNRLLLPILFAALLILPLALMYLHGRTGGRDTILSEAMTKLALPGQTTVATTLDEVTSIWRAYIYLVKVEEQNEELRVERRELLDQVGRCQESVDENLRLQRLLDFKKSRDEMQTITARVIARDTSPWYRVLRVVLDRGVEDRVRSGMPVVTHQGIVGKVERVTGSYCDVMLITDSRSRLSATVAGKEVTGTLVGNGDGMSYSATFQFPFQRVELQADDLLVTTGHEQIYPKGLNVGRLVSGTVNPTGKQLEIQVNPAADLGHLDEVLIITSYYNSAIDPWKEEASGQQH